MDCYRVGAVPKVYGLRTIVGFLEEGFGRV